MTQITMHTSTPVAQCLDMPLTDFVQFFEDLCDEAERVRNSMEQRR